MGIEGGRSPGIEIAPELLPGGGSGRSGLEINEPPPGETVAIVAAGGNAPRIIGAGVVHEENERRNRAGIAPLTAVVPVYGDADARRLDRIFMEEGFNPEHFVLDPALGARLNPLVSVQGSFPVYTRVMGTEVRDNPPDGIQAGLAARLGPSAEPFETHRFDGTSQTVNGVNRVLDVGFGVFPDMSGLPPRYAVFPDARSRILAYGEAPADLIRKIEDRERRLSGLFLPDIGPAAAGVLPPSGSTPEEIWEAIQGQVRAFLARLGEAGVPITYLPSLSYRMPAIETDIKRENGLYVMASGTGSGFDQLERIAEAAIAAGISASTVPWMPNDRFPGVDRRPPTDLQTTRFSHGVIGRAGGGTRDTVDEAGNPFGILPPLDGDDPEVTKLIDVYAGTGISYLLTPEMAQDPSLLQEAGSAVSERVAFFADKKGEAYGDRSGARVIAETIWQRR